MLYNKYLKQNKHKRIIFYYRLMAAPTAEASSDLLSCFKHILMPSLTPTEYQYLNAWSTCVPQP